MTRPRHPKKEIEEVLKYAESKGWEIIVGGSHVWGKGYCPLRTRDGHKIHIFSTPKNPQNHAKSLKRQIDLCEHQAT